MLYYLNHRMAGERKQLSDPLVRSEARLQEKEGER